MGGVGGVDGFGFGGAFLTEPDGEEDHGGDAEEFALPVLEGLEPEGGGAHELEDGELRVAVKALPLVVGSGAGDAVEREGEEEEDEEGEGEGAAVEGAGDATAAGGPGGAG